eukprot:scaffold674189_cov62-Prasinocladus_malaysianus.AAC.1
MKKNYQEIFKNNFSTAQPLHPYPSGRRISGVVEITTRSGIRRLTSRRKAHNCTIPTCVLVTSQKDWRPLAAYLLNSHYYELRARTLLVYAIPAFVMPEWVQRPAVHYENGYSYSYLACVLGTATRTRTAGYVWASYELYLAHPHNWVAYRTA